MKRGKIAILAMTILLSVTVVVFGKVELRRWNFPFSVEIISDNHREDLRCMEIDGEYYVFLPSYAEREEIRFHTNFLYDVYIDGQKLTEETTCADFPKNTELDLYFKRLKEEESGTVTVVQSANILSMYIDVASGQMEYIHAEKGNRESGMMRLYTSDGEIKAMGQLESIQGRGNTTWYSDKKSYSLRFTQEIDLLGVGAAQRWILLSNTFDTSHVRNKFAYDLAEEAGLPNSPQSDWVDLYLNGEYAGLYLLTERNEVHPNRVDLTKKNHFLVSLELPFRLLKQNYAHITTQSGLAFRIHNSSMGEEALSRIWQSTENAILAEDGIDSITGKRWDELIDLETWAHKYLLEELLGNYDAGSVSQYFYYDANDLDGKIYAGPIWDFDNSTGGGEWQAAVPMSFLANRPHFWGLTDKPLFYGLYQKELFYNRILELFQTTYNPLLILFIEQNLPIYVQTVSQAAEMDHIRWKGPDVAENTERMKSYLLRRLDFFRDLWFGDTEYCQVEVTTDFVTWGCFLVPKGECLTILHELDYDALGWYDYDVTGWDHYDALGWYDIDTEEPFDTSEPIMKDKRIYLKR